MQTKNEIERLLAAAGQAPNKQLGQHFLIERGIVIPLLVTLHDQNTHRYRVNEQGHGQIGFRESADDLYFIPVLQFFGFFAWSSAEAGRCAVHVP